MMRRVHVSLIACLALGALVVGASAQALPTGDQPVVARVTITTRADLRRFVELGLDVLEVREGDDLFVVTTAAGVDRLRIDGWTIRIDADHSSTLQRQQQEHGRWRAWLREEPRPAA